MGSNVCTVNAVMGAQKFLRGEAQIPSERNVNESVRKFACTMREENLTYNTLQLPASQPNLDVGEAINIRNDRLGLTILEDVGLFSVVYVENKLKQICFSSVQPGKICAVMIAPPDKSMLICFSHSEQKLALYDSHRHQDNGGIIAVASCRTVGNFARYLAVGTTIAGANITVLATLQWTYYY